MYGTTPTEKLFQQGIWLGFETICTFYESFIFMVHRYSIYIDVYYLFQFIILTNVETLIRLYFYVCKWNLKKTKTIDAINKKFLQITQVMEIARALCYHKIKHWRLPISKILCNYFKPGFGLRLSLLSLRGLSHRLWILANDKKRWLTLIRHMKNMLAGQHWIYSHWAYGVSHISANKNTIFSWKSGHFTSKCSNITLKPQFAKAYRKSEHDSWVLSDYALTKL